MEDGGGYRIGYISCAPAACHRPLIGYYVAKAFPPSRERPVEWNGRTFGYRNISSTSQIAIAGGQPDVRVIRLLGWVRVASEISWMERGEETGSLLH